jgi:hypothetical protein
MLPFLGRQASVQNINLARVKTVPLMDVLRIELEPRGNGNDVHRAPSN